MDKNYYDQLIELYNKSSLNESSDPNIIAMNRQANIADTGSDMQDQGLQPQQENQGNEEMDPSMMDQNLADQEMGTSPVMPQPTPNFELQKQKTLKLYDYLNDLYDYGDAFLESLKQLDIDLIDNENYVKYKKYSDNIQHLVDKIDTYITGAFSTDDYEKELYAYVLFRTEMLTNIKALRDVLKLDAKDDENSGENSK